MGRSHALSGAVVWLGGCAVAAGLGVRAAVGTVVVGAAVTAGGALLSDVDHPDSVIARSLGPLTRLVARGAAAGAAALRAGTCRCCAGRGGHRAVTHTLVFAVTAGLLVSLLCWIGGDVAAAVIAGLAAALAVRGGLRKRTRGAYGAAAAGLFIGVMAAALPGPVAGWWWVGLPLGGVGHVGAAALPDRLGGRVAPGRAHPARAGRDQRLDPDHAVATAAPRHRLLATLRTVGTP